MIDDAYSSITCPVCKVAQEVPTPMDDPQVVLQNHLLEGHTVISLVSFIRKYGKP